MKMKIQVIKKLITFIIFFTTVTKNSYDMQQKWLVDINTSIRYGDFQNPLTNFHAILKMNEG